MSSGWENNFTVSVNGGLDTFSGTALDIFEAPDSSGSQVNTGMLTILGGTGIFNGATGLTTARGLNGPPPQPAFFSGTGEISAGALAPAPEPSTVGYLNGGLIFSLILILRRIRSFPR